MYVYYSLAIILNLLALLNTNYKTYDIAANKYKTEKREISSVAKFKS